MADVKISQMTAASDLDGTEQFETVQGGATRRATSGQLADLARVVAVNNQTATAYTLALADAGRVVRGSNASAQTYTIPTNAAAAIAVGRSVAVRQVAAGQITLTPASGVTLNTPTGFVAKTARQGATIMLHKVAANEWDLTGDLATS